MREGDTGWFWYVNTHPGTDDDIPEVEPIEATFTRANGSYWWLSFDENGNTLQVKARADGTAMRKKELDFYAERTKALERVIELLRGRRANDKKLIYQFVAEIQATRESAPKEPGPSRTIQAVISDAEDKLGLVSLVRERQEYRGLPEDISPEALLAWWRDEAGIQRDANHNYPYAHDIDAYADELVLLGVQPKLLPWEQGEKQGENHGAASA